MMDALVAMPKYEAYRESGVDWLGSIPESWNLKPGLVAFSENKRNNKGMKEDTVLSLSYGKIIIKPEEKLVGLVPESFETYQLVEPSDIIVRCTDLQNDKVSLRTGLAKDKGIITSAYLNLKVKSGFSSRFLHYYLHALDTTKVIYKFGSGLRQNLSFLDFKRLPVFDIPEETQEAIANFLDTKTAQIDEAIAIKEKQIALLKERKQIIIQKAVTQGLNPDVPMKDSGVDWIGKVPEHWAIKKFKHFTKILSGLSPENVTFCDGGVDYFKVDDLNDIDEANRLSESKWKVLNKRSLVTYGSNILLIPKRGGAIGTNKIAITTTESIFDTNVMGLSLDLNKVNMDFVSLFIKQRNLIEIADTTTIPQINNKHINPLPIAIPPLEEQESIVFFLQEKISESNETIAEFVNHIDKLKEYKLTLINSAVTGKIKVA